MKKLVVFLFAAIVAATALTGCTQGESATSGNSTVSTQSTSSKDSKPATEAYQTSLTNGHYTAGIDIPAGKYNLVAKSGRGNVSSSNLFQGGINAIMSATPKTGTESSSFNGLTLKDGDVLTVGSVVIDITSDAAEVSKIKPRENKDSKEVTLKDGNYTVDTDFPAGTYDIVAVSGSGNVSSSNMFSGGLNVVMSPKPPLEMYITEYKNVDLTQKDTTLKISGVTVKLVPSK